MPDVYAAITEVDAATAAALGDAMELRARDPQQREMLEGYVARMGLREGAEVLEIGCGTGAIARFLAALPTVARVVAADPSPHLLERARALAGDRPELSFLEADGAALPLGSGSVDAVVLHTVLTHVPEPARVLEEAFRVLRPGGVVGAFDGDYATISVAAGEGDPLEACADAFRGAYINDAWLGRRLPALLAAAGFADLDVRGHAFVQTTAPDYLLSVVDRGADALAARGLAGPDLVAALKAEARRRVADGTFFGHIGYVSAVASKPRVG